jgi:hypothetical protein
LLLRREGLLLAWIAGELRLKTTSEASRLRAKSTRLLLE